MVGPSVGLHLRSSEPPTADRGPRGVHPRGVRPAREDAGAVSAPLHAGVSVGRVHRPVLGRGVRPAVLRTGAVHVAPQGRSGGAWEAVRGEVVPRGCHLGWPVREAPTTSDRAGRVGAPEGTPRSATVRGRDVQSTGVRALGPVQQPPSVDAVVRPHVGRGRDDAAVEVGGAPVRLLRPPNRRGRRSRSHDGRRSRVAVFVVQHDARVRRGQPPEAARGGGLPGTHGWGAAAHRLTGGAS